MSFRLTSQFTIGNYQFFGGVKEVEIKRHIKEIADTAVITLPAMGIANNNNGMPPNSIATSTLFQPGDPVTIMLGYNYKNVQEFKGFVRRVDVSIPVKIECEGYAWKLRNTSLVGSWPSITLTALLTQLVAGTGIKLSSSIPGITLTNIKFPNINGLKVLEYLKDKALLSAYFVFDTLYVGLEAALPGGTGAAGSTLPVPIHELGWNTMRDDKLKWRTVGDTSVQIRVVSAKGKNAKTPLYTYGQAGSSVITEHLSWVSDPVWIQKLAQDNYNRASYTGYEGSIMGFLQPYIQMCDTATLQDPMYKVRQGKYFTQGTTVKFGVSGATREVFLGQELSV